jgi:hypothetical protein
MVQQDSLRPRSRRTTRSRTSWSRRVSCASGSRRGSARRGAAAPGPRSAIPDRSSGQGPTPPLVRRAPAAGGDRLGARGDPRVLLADEADDARDVTVQAQILELLPRSPTRRGMSRVFITTTLACSGFVQRGRAVMYSGAIAERRARWTWCSRRHVTPTRAALVSAQPGRLPGRRAATAAAVDPVSRSARARPGLRPFRTRCTAAADVCATARRCCRWRTAVGGPATSHRRGPRCGGGGLMLTVEDAVLLPDQRGPGGAWSGLRGSKGE